MRISRIYYSGTLAEGLTIELPDQTTHYLTRVLRVRLGSLLTIFNGTGGEYNAEVTTLDKRRLAVTIGTKEDRNVESPLQIYLGQAISRSEKMDFTIQKAVELGVHHITPLITERCGVKLSHERIDKRIQHWQAIITSACEQSGRNYLPTIAAPMLFNEWLDQSQSDLCLILHPHASKKLDEISITSPQKVSLLIGSEGGFSDEEVNQAMAKNFQPLCLGARILRTETAAIAALAALQCYWGDF